MKMPVFFKSLCFGLGLSLVLIAPCITIYTYNPIYFSFDLLHLGIVLALLSLLCSFMTCTLLACAGSWRHIRKLEFAILALCVLAWMQGGYFATVLPTTPVAVEFGGNLFWLSFKQIAIFAVVIGAMLFFRKFIFKHIMQVLLFIILCQTASIGATIYRFPSYSFSSIYRNCFEENNKFTFAYRENVLLVVVDCLGNKLFKDEIKKYPELEGLFKDFTCLDGMRSPVPRTMAAVPAMLTGIGFQYSEAELGDDVLYPQYLHHAFLENQTLMHRLKSEGFRCEGYQFMPNIALATETCFDNVIPRLKHNASDRMMFKVWCQRMMPYFMHSLCNFKWDMGNMFVNEVNTGHIRNKHLKYDQAMNQRLVREFIVGRDEKVFKYFHLQGAHVDLTTNENLENCEDTDKYRQLRGSLIFIENLFRLLKENNLYDNATIVVTGDHTEEYRPENATLVKAPGMVKDKLDWDDTPYVVADMPGIIQKLRGK